MSLQELISNVQVVSYSVSRFLDAVVDILDFLSLFQYYVNLQGLFDAKAIFIEEQL